MKNFLLVLTGVALLWHSKVSAQSSSIATATVHPPRCGILQLKEALIAKDPSFADRFEQQKAAMQTIANNYTTQKQSGVTERTTSVISPIPVIFHIVVDSAQFNQLGGTAGIAVRCDSQIAVLNRDFNRENADSTSIPSSWEPYYANVGIRFGLAVKDPSGSISPGYEVKIISGTGFSNEGGAFPEAKKDTTGLASWDVTKYYNVWCINFTGGANGLLGLTMPLSFCSASTKNQEGVCILYTTLGCTATDRTPPANTGGTSGWSYPYNLGRTLTHETGHFFEIWHPWGDDGGQCPSWSSDSTIAGSGLSGGDNGITCTSGVGFDDGLSDTPPESDAVYGNPSYTITGGTTNDCCQKHGLTNTQPIGIACLSYMDYTDDDAMHMFTNMQAAAMASMVLVPSSSVTGADGSGTVGENYSLTQNPSLTQSASAVATVNSVSNSLNIFPNPTTGQVTLTLDAASDKVNQILIVNLLGQEVMTINGQNKDYYSIDLSGMSKGIYFIKCNFASGSITRKISLQ